VRADDHPWEPWSPAELTARLAGLDVPWYVAGGWGLDLFLGGQRRPHEDLEIGVPASRFHEIESALTDVTWWRHGHQTWALAGGAWRLDVFREPGDDDGWICRRDASIRLPYAELIERTPAGFPFGRPEVLLLFKAKAARPKDDDDLAAVLPHLDVGRRRWLAEALALVHPGHRWIETTRPG
jgi:Aminoglycoside-2''-adenylyltransferase